MTTDPVTCVSGTDIDPAKLGVLLHALASSDETALDDTDYFDPSWASDVPNPPELPDNLDDPNDPAMGRSRGRRGSTYHRVVAVKGDAYVGFLAGRFESDRAYVAVAAALNPGNGDGVGPKLLDAFSKLASDAEKSRLELMPDRGNRHADRVRFFERYGFEWCEGSTTHMCKPLASAKAAPVH